MSSGIWSAIELAAHSHNPKDGRIIAQSSNQAEIEALWVAGKVVIGWTCDTPIVRYTPERLAKSRQTRMRNKLEKHAPLFADELEARELANRPQFYSGTR